MNAELMERLRAAQRLRTLWLPRFRLRGRRYRPRIVWTGKWREPMRLIQNFGPEPSRVATGLAAGDRVAARYWLGPFMLVCLVDDGEAQWT